MGEETGGFVVAVKTVSDKILTILVIDLLGKDCFHTAIPTAFKDVRSINFDGTTIFGAKKTKGEIKTIDCWLHKDGTGSIIHKLKIRFGDIDGSVHPVGFVVLDGISMVAAFTHLEAAVDCGSEDST